MLLQESDAFTPSVGSTALVLDAYRRFQAREGARPSASVLSPLDATLVGTLLEFCTEAPVVVDLAGAATAGESTLLARIHPRLRKLCVPPSPPQQESPVESVQRFLADSGPVRPARVEVLPDRWCAPPQDGPQDFSCAGSEAVLVCCTADHSPEALVATVDSFLGRAPQSLVLVFPVARMGDCPHLQALLARYSHRSAHVVRVLREEGEFFGGSGLALMHRRDAGRITEGLERLFASYRGNCSFLDLLLARYHTAIQRPAVEQAALSSRGWNWLSQYDDQVGELHRQLQERNELLQEYSGIPALGRLWRSYRWSVRNARRALEVFRQAGFREVWRRAVRRCLRLRG
jgi:hypothetical protein